MWPTPTSTAFSTRAFQPGKFPFIFLEGDCGQQASGALWKVEASNRSRQSVAGTEYDRTCLTWGKGRSVAHSHRAVIGHRGSLLPRYF